MNNVIDTLFLLAFLVLTLGSLVASFIVFVVLGHTVLGLLLAVPFILIGGAALGGLFS